MNGKRAKALRRVAQEIVKDFDPEPNYYRVEQNHMELKQVPHEVNGKTEMMLTPVKVDGTRHHNTPFMIMYNMKKKQFYRRRADERGMC